VDDLRIGPTLTIPDDELTEAFSRAGGPGGQNVNKVSSKVELRWNLPSSRALSPEVREQLLARLGKQLTVAGDLLVVSSRTRDQVRNRADARERLAELVRAALVRPRKRKKTRPSRGSVERRLGEKKRRALTKRARRGDE
jgi:ribosome-associated protein